MVTAGAGKNDSGSYYRPGKWASANLIEPCNNRESLLLQAAFEKKSILPGRIKQGQNRACLLW